MTNSITISFHGDITVQTIDELRLMTPSCGSESALVLGKTAVGDGGGGIFHYSSTDAGYCKTAKLRRRVTFDSGGTYEVTAGNTITGATSGATAEVHSVTLDSGTWAGGDAEGTFVLESYDGRFAADETLNVGASTDVATVKADAETGSGYTTASITVTGDGTGMKLIPIVEKGIIRYIVVANVGIGYTTATATVTGDGTGAEIAIELTQDDGGILIRPTGIDPSSKGRWRRQFDGEINARWFGATGDSTTDDTTALQNFLDACLSWSTPGYIPAGVYRITDGLTVTGSGTSVHQRGIHVRGAGKRATYIRSEYEGWALSLIGGSAGEVRFLYGLRLSDIAFVASELRKANTNGLYCLGLWYSIFENIATREFGGTGWKIDNTVGDYDSMAHFRMSQCDSEWNGDLGFDFDGTGGITVCTLDGLYASRNGTAQGRFIGVGHGRIVASSFTGQDRDEIDGIEYDGDGLIIDQCRGLSVTDCELGNALNDATVILRGGWNIAFKWNRFLRRGGDETQLVGIRVTGETALQGLEVVQNTLIADTAVSTTWKFVELAENVMNNGSIIIRDNHVPGTMGGGVIPANTVVPDIDTTQFSGLVLDYDDGRGVLYRYRPRQIHEAMPLSFNSGGTYEVQIGDTLTGASSGETADVVSISLTSGSWAGGNATGTFFLENRTGTFTGTENLNVGANLNVATTPAATSYTPNLLNGTVHIISPATSYISLGTPTRVGNFQGVVLHIYILNDGTLTGNITLGSAYIAPVSSGRLIPAPEEGQYAHVAFMWVPSLSKWLWTEAPSVSVSG